MPGRSTKAATAGRQAGSSRRATGSVEKRVSEYLKGLPKEIAESPEAAALTALAQSIDQAESHHARSMCAKEFRELMSTLRAMAPAKEEPDALDQLSERRAARISAA